MHELLMSKAKNPELPPPTSLTIEGSGAPNTWTATSGVSLNGDGSYNFTGTVLDTLRIPYQNTPFPTGEAVDIRLRAIIYTIYEPAKPVYFLSKWAGATAGENFYDFVLQRHTDGKFAYNVGSMAAGKYITTAAITLNKEFEIRWVVDKNGAFTLKFDGTLVATGNLPAWRQSPLDWMIGSFLNAAQTAGTTNGARTNWKLIGLRIIRGKT